MFDTYGPFVLQSHDKASLDDLFTQIKKANPTLKQAMGVYLVFGFDGTGSTIPWYVGRTREFEARIRRHFQKEKFSSLLAYGPIRFFLLPRATGRGKLLTATEKTPGNAKEIRQLEFFLIGTCLKLNPALLNKQETEFFKRLHVAGYIDKGPEDRYFPAAKQLSKLLKI